MATTKQDVLDAVSAFVASTDLQEAAMAELKAKQGAVVVAMQDQQPADSAHSSASADTKGKLAALINAAQNLSDEDDNT